MKTIIILIMHVLLVPLLVLAQKDKIHTITDTATVLFPDNKSKEEVEKEAFNQAVLNGLEKEFGRAIMEGDQLYLMNLHTGEKAKTTSYFTNWSGTYVTGEFLGNKEKPRCGEVVVTSYRKGKEIPLKGYNCKVTFKARAVSAAKPQFDSYPLFAPCKKCQASSFKEGDTLYLYFKSPSSGYLSVYLDDGKNCQRLFPYNRMDAEFEKGVFMKSDQEYFLFSRDKQFDYYGNKDLAEIYGLYPDSEMDIYTLYILFSDEEIAKPALIEGIGSETLSKKDKEAGFTLPKGLSSKEFQEWLSEKKMQSKTLTVSPIPITVIK